jgi:dynein heavy chain, axonemal
MLRQFAKLTNQVTTNERAWKVWFDKAAPEEESIPDGYQSLDPFRRLLLIRAWCPDRTLSQCRKYLAASLGPKYSDPVILNFDTMLEESRPLTPLICFLTMGSDPTPSIEALTDVKSSGRRVLGVTAKLSSWSGLYERIGATDHGTGEKT